MINETIGPPLSAQEIVSSSLDDGIRLQGIVSDLKGVLLINDTKMPFISTDNPAIAYNKFVMLKEKRLRNWGLSSPGLFLYLPISPSLAYLAYDQSVYHLEGREGRMCALDTRDVVQLNALALMHCDKVVFLPGGNAKEHALPRLRKVKVNMPDGLVRMNFAVEDKEFNSEGSRRFVRVSREEFLKEKRSGLFHFENVPPRVTSHFKRLKFLSRPKFISQGTRALRYLMAPGLVD